MPSSLYKFAYQCNTCYNAMRMFSETRRTSHRGAFAIIEINYSTTPKKTYVEICLSRSYACIFLSFSLSPFLYFRLSCPLSLQAPASFAMKWLELIYRRKKSRFSSTEDLILVRLYLSPFCSLFFNVLFGKLEKSDF